MELANSVRRLVHPRLLMVPVLLALAAAPAFATSVTFRYQPVIGGVNSVSVAGSFNGWSVTANPLQDADKDGIWSAEVELPPGRVEYKFVVNGDQWFTDETAAETSPDGFGGQNSVLVVAGQPLVAGHGSTVRKAAAPPLGLRQVPFRFRPATKPESVSLAGTFNDWTVGKTPMTDADADGEYTATLLLAPGSYQYKFVVNSSGWTQDTAGQDGEADDGFGGKNSIRNVDDRFAAIAVRKGDGEVFPDGVEHTQGAQELNALGGGVVELTTRAHRDDVSGVDLVWWGTGPESRVPMKLVEKDRVYEYFRTELRLPEGARYVFQYRDGPAGPWLGSQGLSKARSSEQAFIYDSTRFPPFVTPDWVKHGIIYQIFPDRFQNGDPGNDPDFKEWYYAGKTQLPPSGRLDPEFQEYYHLARWDDVAALTQAPHTPDRRDWMAFYGGDIEGVRQKLDYLKALGVTIVYFNPLFEAKSTHKYDAADYRKIDPHFGTNEAFIAFVKEARARGIRVVLDIVFNHSGNSHWAFKDAVEKGSRSSTWSWFEFKQWPLPAGWPNVGRPWKPGDYYYCWWNFGDLPDLNFDLSRDNKAENAVRDVKDAQPNVGLIQYLLDATEYWLKDADVDGVRLDVPNEVPYWFWKLFNARVKQLKPDAYIVGELWGNASDYVKPGMYDAVMNYAYFRDPVLRFLCNAQGTAAEFDATLATGRLAYPRQSVAVQMNLIDSHDTVRYLTQAGGDVNRLLLAALFQMTYVGAPAIYYGDEVAMEGARDPDCRRPFPWDWDKDARRSAVHAYYTKVTNLRLQHAALRTGEFRTLSTEGQTMAYLRSDAQARFVVVLNAGRQPATVTLDTAALGGAVKAADALEGGAPKAWSGKVTLELPAGTGRVYRLTR